MNNPNTATRRRLPPQIERFVAAYMANANATGAALKAGYAPRSAKQQGSRLLKRPDVIEAMREHRKLLGRQHVQTLERIALDGERTREALARLAYFDPRKLVNPDGSAKNLHELDEQSAAAVAGFEVSESWIGSGKNRCKVITTKVRLVNRVAALDMAAKVTGEYATDNQQRRNVREMSDDDIRARILELIGQAKPADTPIQ